MECGSVARANGSRCYDEIAYVVLAAGGLRPLPEMANVSSQRVRGTGHFVTMEKPEEFNCLLAGFLKYRAAWK
jgi:pimeloyl-ACP methyl ester carboxylesterase